jgi:Tripartite tricarboxylate transporter family receptor
MRRALIAAVIAACVVTAHAAHSALEDARERAFPSEASGQRGNSNEVRAHSGSEEHQGVYARLSGLCCERAGDTRPEQGSSARAADWPARPVRIVWPFAPGGTSHTLGRLLAEQLTERLGQQFFVENRGGAGGLIGSAAVANAEPDGATFLISSVGTHVTSPATSANPGYDPLRNFTHVAYLGGPPNVIVVHLRLG